MFVSVTVTVQVQVQRLLSLSTMNQDLSTMNTMGPKELNLEITEESLNYGLWCFFFCTVFGLAGWPLV